MSDDDNDGPDLRCGVPVSALPRGALLAGSFDGEPVVLVNDGGRVCAWSGQCTHLGGPLGEGLFVDGQLRCPWHHARFSAGTGEALAAPAFRPLTRYAVESRDDQLFVTGRAPSVPVSRTAKAPPPAIVVVGGGAAGHAFVEMLDRHGFGHGALVISDDADAPYDRTFCSKQYLIGMKTREDTALADPRFFRDGGPVLRLKTAARSIDVDARELVLESGERLPFDVLVLATGAEPQRPDKPGFDGPGVHVLRTLQDADALIAAARPGTRAVVVGASFVGLEAAASMTQRQVKVDVVAPDAIPLEKIVGPDVGRMIRDVHEEKGVMFHLGREVEAWDGRRLSLDDGSTLDADFVVVGVGVTPRVELAKDAGLAVASRDDGGGVIVDAHLQTSAPGIYAIGDVARYPDAHVGASIRVEHWVHAQRQGQYLARRLMGQGDDYVDLPFFWSAHFDTGLRYLGHVERIADMQVDGTIAGRDFTVGYSGTNCDRAFTTCNRDLPALRVEAEWERPA